MSTTTPSSNPALADIRHEYALKTLGEGDVDRDPLKQFGVWMVEAIHAQVPEPTAMTLSTVDVRGQPTGRVCLLKGMDGGGFVFYTNYLSRKGRELEVNPKACMTFFWKELERQVRIEGTVSMVTPEESEAYFVTRPLGSRIGAWASPQSQVIESRQWLEGRIEALSKEHGENPSRPAHWGGYRLDPAYVEFWQGRMSRLHDRIAYTRDGGSWRIARLAP